MRLFIYPSVKSCVLGAQKNRLIETVLLSTHNICFGWEIKKISYDVETVFARYAFKHQYMSILLKKNVKGDTY